MWSVGNRLPSNSAEVRPPAPRPIVVFLSGEGRADHLLAEHVDDTTGHCAVCSAGAQTGRTTWPCSLASYAAAARDMAAGQPTQPITPLARTGLDTPQ